VEPSGNPKVTTMFLTIDLTEATLREAIAAKANLIVSYHPPIFAPLKRLTMNSVKERIIVKAIEASIAIYSPHTAWDNVQGGINDWLVREIVGTDATGTVQPVNENVTPPQGRKVALKKGLLFDDLVLRVKTLTGLAHVRIAGASNFDKRKITSVAVCAGSGSSVLRGVRADALVTGEMSHHEVLDVIAYGKCVILCEHTNSERGFLGEFAKLFRQMSSGSMDIVISKEDADPLTIS